MDGTIDLRKMKKEQVNTLLLGKGYTVIENDNDYKYLVKMTMDSVTEENVEKLFKDHDSKKVELEIIQKTDIRGMWSSELDTLTTVYLEYKEQRERLLLGEDTKPKKKQMSSSSSNLKKKTKNMIIKDE